MRHRLALHGLVAGIALAAVVGAARLDSSGGGITNLSVFNAGLSQAPAGSLVTSEASVLGPVSLLTAEDIRASSSNTGDDFYLQPKPSTLTIQTEGALARRADAEVQNLTNAVTLDSVTGAVDDAVEGRRDVAGSAGDVVALGDIIDPKQPFFIHIIRPGDTAFTLAQEFGVTVETILLNNPHINEGDLLIVDQELVIPRGDGMLHTIATGDTLEKIAASYEGGTIESITGFGPNSVASDGDLVPGNRVLVLGARPLPPPPPPPPPPAQPDPAPAPGSPSAPPSNDGGGGGGGGQFIWPVHGPLSDYFGSCRSADCSIAHTGIDIDLWAYAVQGTHAQLYASAGGVVVRADWSTYGYGYHVVIDHGGGISTLYAHMSDIWVTPGQFVSQGDAIGLSGSTGYSTGEHLHFEILINGSPVNPLLYLP